MIHHNINSARRSSLHRKSVWHAPGRTLAFVASRVWHREWDNATSVGAVSEPAPTEPAHPYDAGASHGSSRHGEDGQQGQARNPPYRHTHRTSQRISHLHGTHQTVLSLSSHPAYGTVNGIMPHP